MWQISACCLTVFYLIGFFFVCFLSSLPPRRWLLTCTVWHLPPSPAEPTVRSTPPSCGCRSPARRPCGWCASGHGSFLGCAAGGTGKQQQDVVWLRFKTTQHKESLRITHGVGEVKSLKDKVNLQTCAFIFMHLLFPVDSSCFAGFCFVSLNPQLHLSDGRFGNKVVSHFNDCAPASAASDLYLGSVFLKLENFCIPAPTSETSSAVCKRLSQQQMKRTNKYQRLSFSKINLMCEDEGKKSERWDSCSVILLMAERQDWDTGRTVECLCCLQSQLVSAVSSQNRTKSRAGESGSGRHTHHSDVSVCVWWASLTNYRPMLHKQHTQGQSW